MLLMYNNLLYFILVYIICCNDLHRVCTHSRREIFHEMFQAKKNFTKFYKNTQQNCSCNRNSVDAVSFVLGGAVYSPASAQITRGRAGEFYETFMKLVRSRGCNVGNPAGGAANRSVARSEKCGVDTGHPHGESRTPSGVRGNIPWSGVKAP